MVYFKNDDTIISMQIMKLHYKLWRLCGVWPRSTDRLPYRIYSYFLYLVGLIWFNLHILLSLGQAVDTSEVVDIILPCTTTLNISITAFFLIYNQQYVIRIFEQMQTLEMTLQPDELTTLLKTKVTTNKLAIAMTVSLWLACLFCFLRPCFSANRALLWTAWFPFDWTQAARPTLYYVALTYQLLGNTYMAVLLTSFQLCAPSLYMILSAFIDILCKRLESIGQMAHDRNSPEEQLKECIRFHNICLEYSSNSCLWKCVR